MLLPQFWYKVYTTIFVDIFHLVIIKQNNIISNEKVIDGIIAHIDIANKGGRKNRYEYIIIANIFLFTGGIS